MNARTKVDVETRMKMAVDLIELLHRRIDGLTAEVAELRRKVDPAPGYVRKLPKDEIGLDIIDGLVAEAAIASGISAGMICSKVRTREVVRARQWVIFEACARGLSTVQVGRLMDRDHTTVMHANRVEAARRAG